MSDAVIQLRGSRQLARKHRTVIPAKPESGSFDPVKHTVDPQDRRWVPFEELEGYDFVSADVPFVQKLRTTYR